MNQKLSQNNENSNELVQLKVENKYLKEKIEHLESLVVMYTNQQAKVETL